MFIVFFGGDGCLCAAANIVYIDGNRLEKWMKKKTIIVILDWIVTQSIRLLEGVGLALCLCWWINVRCIWNIRWNVTVARMKIHSQTGSGHFQIIFRCGWILLLQVWNGRKMMRHPNVWGLTVNASCEVVTTTKGIFNYIYTISCCSLTMLMIHIQYVFSNKLLCLFSEMSEAYNHHTEIKCFHWLIEDEL